MIVMLPASFHSQPQVLKNKLSRPSVAVLEAQNAMLADNIRDEHLHLG